MTTQQPEALAADHSGDATDMVGRWYMVNKMGMATLCASKADAEKEAADAQRFWPHMGPHRAVQLVEAADVEAMRAGYDAARLEIESLRATLATPRPAPQADSQPAQVEVADAMADSQYLAGVSAGWNAANADDPNEALRKLHESRAGYLKPLHAARAPADSQPARDERDDFEKVFPLPSGCIRVGTGYASTGYSNWAAHTHVERWEGWQARAARAPADSVQDLQPVHDAVTIDLLNERVAYLERKLQEADSVLEDAARWQMAALIGNEVMLHPDKRTNPAAVKAYMDAVHSGLDLTGAIDAARKQGANHD